MTFPTLDLRETKPLNWRCPIKGSTIAQLNLHYSNGTVTTLDIVHDAHARDWWNRNDPEVSDGQVVWTVDSDPSEDSPFARRLYHSVWDNPHPDRTLKSIDFVTTDRKAASLCVAITLEE